MQRLKIIILLLLFSFTLFQPVESQSSFPSGDKDEYYGRLLQISGVSDDKATYQLRPYDYGIMAETLHPWQNLFSTQNSSDYLPVRFIDFDFYQPVLFQSYNTALPRGTNDGAVWQGRGYNMAFSTGLGISAGPLQIRFRPVVGYSQNRSFGLGPYEPPLIRGEDGNVTASEFAYRDFRGSIDYVQRFGEDPFSWFDFGDSFAELRYAGIRAAFSNERIWTGPSLQTSLQLGYSAPGFMHLYFGTYKPLNTFAGSFEFAYIFGGMRKSDYFDGRSASRMQSVNSVIFIYSPWFTEHFSIGAMRTYFHPYPSNFEQFKSQASKLFDPGLRGALADGDDTFADTWDPDNQLASIFFRYYLPSYGIEIYSEYGRNDHNMDWRDFRAHPDHQRAYTLGLLKTFIIPKNRLLAIHLEINQLETNRTSLTRGNEHLGGWYTHGAQVQGFTNQGQIPGTGYGPGVNIQMIRADLFDPRGSLSIKFARIIYHNSRVDQFFEYIQQKNRNRVDRWEVRNFEFLLGTEFTAFLSAGIELSAALEQSFIFNHHNLKGNDLGNTRLELVIRKKMKGWLR
jgi:hypothetical protein